MGRPPSGTGARPGPSAAALALSAATSKFQLLTPFTYSAWLCSISAWAYIAGGNGNLW